MWVVLMVPVSVFAAVAAMAVPQRLAAESSIEEAAADLAMLALAWRDGRQASTGAISAFPLDCALNATDTAQLASLAEHDLAARDELFAELTGFVEMCEQLHDSVVRDLGHLGVDMNSLRGYYSDSLREATEGPDLPCTATPTLEVSDAVHVALVADWGSSSWASSQVWPDGKRIGSEAISRMSRNTPPQDDDTRPPCQTSLDLVDVHGNPTWLTDDGAAREFTQSVPMRTPFSG